MAQKLIILHHSWNVRRLIGQSVRQVSPVVRQQFISTDKPGHVTVKRWRRSARVAVNESNQVDIIACKDHFAIQNNIHLKDYYVRITVNYTNKLYFDVEDIFLLLFAVFLPSPVSTRKEGGQIENNNFLFFISVIFTYFTIFVENFIFRTLDLHIKGHTDQV